LFGGIWDWLVDRGANGTTPASHADEATLTPHVEVVGTSAFSANGVAQTVSLLGPFHVAHDDVGIDTDGVLLASLGAGTWLLNTIVISTEQWDGITDDNFSFEVGLEAGVAPAGGYRVGLTIIKTIALGLPPPITGIIHTAASATPTDPDGHPIITPVGLSEAGVLVCVFYPDGVPTVGEADIYALIAIPA
jgi:hypothetical protein